MKARRPWWASGEYCSTGPIAQHLGISRRRADQLTRRADFPAPAQVLGGVRIWRVADVLRWAALRGRPIPDLSTLPAREPSVC